MIMRKLQIALVIGFFFIGTSVFSQYLPVSYEGILNNIVENFETIRGANSVKDGSTSLRLLSADKIVLRLEHKRKVKTLTFIRKKDEEGNKYWVSANSLTTDMINKYEKFVTKELTNMLEVSKEKSQE
jgi:hypothetical protein